MVATDPRFHRPRLDMLASGYGDFVNRLRRDHDLPALPFDVMHDRWEGLDVGGLVPPRPSLFDQHPGLIGGALGQ